MTPLTTVTISSTRDGASQPCRVSAPRSGGAPLLVFLHQWSHSHSTDDDAWAAEAIGRGWGYLHPEFRGPNNRPQACGSELAQQDILDAINWACREWPVDPRRVYLAGVSGGGHMAMLMAGRACQQFAAVSAWVGIADLAAWHRHHTAGPQPGKYALDIERCVGGTPGSSPRVDAELRARSPIFHLHAARDLPLDLSAGVWDGRTGSVPFRQTIDAFNILALVHGATPVSEEEIAQLHDRQQLDRPLPGDTAPDPLYAGRAILLRRHAGPARLTIFDGGHEGFPAAACSFLEPHARSCGGQAVAQAGLPHGYPAPAPCSVASSTRSRLSPSSFSISASL